MNFTTTLTRLAGTGVLVLATLTPVASFAAEWQTLFNGKDLSGWKANIQPNSFSVQDGAIRVNSSGRKAAHLFYVGENEKKPVLFRNFELEATVRGEPRSNSGIFFHTTMKERNAQGHLADGYEVQLNSTQKEKRKTGSLYAILDLDKSPVDDSKWFKIRVKVQEKQITVHLNDEKVLDYVEPENPQRPKARAGRLISPDGGMIAFQAHDRNSVWYFKEIRIQKLDD